MTHSSEQSRRVEKVLKERNTYRDTKAWLAAMAAAVANDPGIEEDTLSWLQQELRGHYGEEYLKIRDDYDPHVHFWQLLADRFPQQPKLRALFADTLLITGRDRDLALSQFLQAVAADPRLYPAFAGDFYDIARELGGDRWLEFRLAELCYAVAEDDPEHAGDLTKALVQDFGDSPAILARIKACARLPGTNG
jgi:hypothetical protein